MPWQFIVQVRDVGGRPVSGASLQLSTWAGTGNVLVNPRQTIGDQLTFTAADDVINIIVDLIHSRFGPLTVNILRSAGESTWRWTDPRQRVISKGNSVTIEATLFRTRAAPTVYIPEDELSKRAAAAEAPLEAKAKADKKPVPPVQIDNLAGVLREQSSFYRASGGRTISSFHLMAADPLGDDKASGWKRFKSTLHANLSPWMTGRIQMIEYGEIGTNGPYGPRFLVGIYLPNELLKVGRKSLDFMVWFSPNPRLPNYPQVDYPFRGDYPYPLMAMGGASPYQAHQTYVELPYAHLNPSQHYLAYQMLAARRACAIIIPIAPSAHFELWQSAGTLMRMLKDICRWLPRDDDGRQPKVYPAPPIVGRVGVSGFSAAGVHLLALLNKQGVDPHYTDEIWGTQNDAAEFDRAWGELWSVDNNLGSQFRSFINRGAAWSRQGDRHFCVYKNEFTGPWRPEQEPDGAFSRAMKNAETSARGGGANWAISMAEKSGRIHAVSVSKTYVVSPAETDDPTMPNQTHENMPRLFFGHAAVTSRYTKLS